MQNLSNPKKIFIIVNDPIFIYQHLTPIIEILKEKSRVYIISAYKEQFKLNFQNVKVINVPIKREPAFIDFYALIKFLIIRIKYKPNMCISFTAKAGLINSLTSLVGGKSFHYFTGQRWANLKGLKRFILKLIDKFIILSCLKIYCDSKSQAEFISKELNVPKIKILGKGSISGVNIDKFTIQRQYALKKLSKFSQLKTNNLISLLKASHKKKIKIICFIGRVNKDKGIRELIKGFKLHNNKFKDSYLLIIGPNELQKHEFRKIKDTKNCLYIDFFNDINLILPFAYCMILPSYREGFGSIIIEAAASKVPIIVTNIPGPKDFINHMNNGYLIRSQNSNDIKKALNFYRENNKILKIFSKNAYDRCCKYFSEEYVCNLFAKEILNNI